MILDTFIVGFITLCGRHHIAGKVPESKDFYKVVLWSSTIVSMCSSESKLNSMFSFNGFAGLSCVLIFTYDLIIIVAGVCLHFGLLRIQRVAVYLYSVETLV